MLNAQRLARMTEMVEADGFLTIRQIMAEFGISRSSAMRDLDELERQGVVIRKRGGAVLKDETRRLKRVSEPATAAKSDVHVSEKQQAARQAASLVRDGDCIFLDSGSTTACMMPYLKDRDVTIVTPNIFLLKEVPQGFPGRVCLLGGDFDPDYAVTTGPLARQILQAFWFDRVFISVNGMAAGQAWANELGVAEIKQEAMKRADASVLVADRSKETERGMYAFAPLTDFDLVITEENREDEREEKGEDQDEDN